MSAQALNGPSVARRLCGPVKSGRNRLRPGTEEWRLCHGTAVHTQVFASSQIEAIACLVNGLHRRLPLHLVGRIATAELLLSSYRVLPSSGSPYGLLVSQQEHPFSCLCPPSVGLGEQLQRLCAVDRRGLRIAAVRSRDSKRDGMNLLDQGSVCHIRVEPPCVPPDRLVPPPTSPVGQACDQ